LYISHLKWNKHIEYLLLLVGKFFYIFCNLRSIFDKIQLRIVYILLVQSVITYGIESRGCAYDVHLKKLKITVNKIIKFILKLPSYTSFDAIYNDLNVFNFDKLFKKCLLLFMYKHINIIPICKHNLNTRFKSNVNLYYIPKCYKSFGLKSTLNSKYCYNFVYRSKNYYLPLIIIILSLPY